MDAPIVDDRFDNGYKLDADPRDPLCRRARR